MPRRERHPSRRIPLAWIRRTLCAGLLLLAPVATSLPGCVSEERDPNQPLNADEGAALLHEIRDEPGRMQTLTPQERQYLMRTLKK